MSAALATIPQESIARARELQREAHAENTRLAYGFALEGFRAWARERAIPEASLLPAEPALVASFLADEAAAGLAPKTISLRACAISYAHKKARLPNPCATLEVEETLRGIRRRAAGRDRRAAALTPELLLVCLAAIDRSRTIGKRDALLMTLGLATGARRGELTAFDLEHVSDDGDGLEVIFARSKTDQEGEGCVLYVPMASDPALCAVRAYRDWIEASGISEGALLRAVTHWGKVGARLGGRDVDRIVRLIVQRAGLTGRFSSHSLRAGLVTGLAERGRTEVEIMQQSRHKSSAMVRLYSRSADAKGSTPLKGAW